MLTEPSTAGTTAAWPRAIWLYLASFLIVGLSLSVLGPALTELRERSDSGLGDIGVLFVGQSLGYIVGSFVGGRLFDRFVGHRVYAGALMVVAVGMATVPLFDGLSQLFASFVVIGLGASVADLGANTLLMWQLGAGGGKAMNLLHLCFGIGALTAPLLVHVGIDTATRVAAVGCVGLAGWAYTLPSPSAAAQAREEHTEATLPLMMILCAFFAIYVGLELGFAGWVHTYAEEIHFSAIGATWLTTTFWIGFTLGRILASAIADRVAPATVLVVSCSLALCASVVLVVGDGRTAAVWAGTALMGGATAPQFPGMMNLAERRLHITGSATMWFVGGAGIGGLVFPFVVGEWFDASGARALPWAALLFAVLTFAAYVVAERALHRPSR